MPPIHVYLGAEMSECCRMRNSLLATSVVAVVLGCGGNSEDKPTATCGRVFDAICAKWIECHTTLGSGGAVITQSFCQQNRSNGVSNCATESSAAINMASDAQINACVQALTNFACASLCNQVPQGPAECDALGQTMSTDIVYCASP